MIDLFSIEHEQNLALLSMDTSLKYMAVVVAGMYNEYVSSMTSTDDRKV